MDTMFNSHRGRGSRWGLGGFLGWGAKETDSAVPVGDPVQERGNA
jgi:hypothetical protein